MITAEAARQLAKNSKFFALAERASNQIEEEANKGKFSTIIGCNTETTSRQVQLRELLIDNGFNVNTVGASLEVLW